MSKPLDMGDGCRKHPCAEQGVGICSLCLRERLVKIAESQSFNNSNSNNNVYVQADKLDRTIELKQPEPLPRSQSVGVEKTSDEFQRKQRRSFSLLSLFRNEEIQTLKTSSESRRPTTGKARESAGDSNLETEQDGKFICLDFERKDAASWISLLLRKSKRRESWTSKRSSFSGTGCRPSFESERPSLDEVLSRKLPAYEKEMARRQEALKAGGWEVRLSPASRRGCNEDETDYFSDSSVLGKRRIRSLSRLLRKAGHYNGNANLQVGSKEKKNAKVANCVLNGGGDRDKFGLRRNASWARTLASPLWKPKRGRERNSDVAGSSFSPSSLSFVASPFRPGRQCTPAMFHVHKSHCNSSAS